MLRNQRPPTPGAASRTPDEESGDLGGLTHLGSSGAPVAVLVVRAGEEIVVARETAQLLSAG
jgi:hypothetical protein